MMQGVNDLPPPRPPANAPRSEWPWLLALVPLGVGAYLGYLAAYQSTLGGFSGIGAAFIAMGIGALVVVTGLVGIANALRPAGRGQVASRYAFAAAGLIAAGGVGGGVVVPLLDLGYQAPVVLTARGEASAILSGVSTFEPRAGGRADCRSVPDGTDVGEVVALSLGQLNGGLLRADIFLPVTGMADGSISLFIDAAHLPEGSISPMWDAQEVDVDVVAGGATGSLRFEAVPTRVDPEMGAPAGSWPATLAGEISWACELWLTPDLTPPPAIAGQMTLDLSGVDWNATSGAETVCEFEADGSVWTVSAREVGSLQGKPMAVQLDLGGDPRTGDEVHLSLSVHLATPSGAASLPLGALVAATSGRTISWTDLVPIDEVSPDGLSGRLTFNDLPMETTPDLAWPASLSGELAWECG